jgi:uncharacterized cupredoxin-like copper-binding protein
MKARVAVLAVVTATALPMIVGYAFTAAGASDTRVPLGPGVATVELDMRYSKFSQTEIRVYAGTLVRFEVTNSDPINHEFIVGASGVHASHESGHDKFHPPVPGEVSVKPDQTGLTTYRFDQPGTVLFACHLPGHFGYGMQGTVIVVPIPVAGAK